MNFTFYGYSSLIGDHLSGQVRDDLSAEVTPRFWRSGSYSRPYLQRCRYPCLAPATRFKDDYGVRRSGQPAASASAMPLAVRGWWRFMAVHDRRRYVRVLLLLRSIRANLSTTTVREPPNCPKVLPLPLSVLPVYLTTLKSQFKGAAQLAHGYERRVQLVQLNTYTWLALPPYKQTIAPRRRT